MKKKSLFILLAILLIGGTIALYAYKEYDRKPVDTSVVSPDFISDAKNLLAEFQSNDSVASKKYNDKVLQVEGLVKEIVKDENGFYSISLGDSTSMSSVRCSMDSIFNGDAEKVIKGKNVSIKGVCSGYNADELLGSDLILVRCNISK